MVEFNLGHGLKFIVTRTMLHLSDEKIMISANKSDPRCLQTLTEAYGLEGPSICVLEALWKTCNDQENVIIHRYWYKSSKYDYDLYTKNGSRIYMIQKIPDTFSYRVYLADDEKCYIILSEHAIIRKIKR